ncbi:MAG TPA: EAL domain-containing protein [Steroidobacteraceae bacterium]|jgi:diguanylate cyclase (GGDEF)-like protein/PAS domain S-box-containing protein
MSDAATVLLIDASPDDQRMIREELAEIRGHPYALEIATTLSAGLVRLKRGGVDVILLDLQLPDSLGLTTFLRLQPKANDIPIVVLIGPSDEELGAEAVARGALDHLVKQQVVSNLLDKALRYATERTHTLLALKASEARYRELYENVVAGVFQSTPDGKFMSANPALVRLLGYASEDELLGIDIGRDLYMYPEDRDNWIRNIQETGEIRNAELLLKRKDGRKIVVLENSRAVRDDHGRVLYYEGTLTDITEAHELSQQLSYEASHDALTGLINRREFELRLQRAIESAQLGDAKHALCYVDLDNFKVINDTCGHVAGDELLRQLAHTLQQRIRTHDSLARLGGDEFAVLLHDCALEHAAEVAQGMRRAIEQYQFVWGANSFFTGSSIGVVPIDGTHRRVTQVLSAADAACYAAKDQGRNRVHVYREDDSAVVRRHGELQWVSRVKRALNDQRFFLEAQPIVPVADQEARVHYELLVRLRDENDRRVPPGAFMPAVDRYNLSSRLDRWVIGAAFAWLKRNMPNLRDVERFFINLSGETLADLELGSYIIQGLRESDISPERIGFEITESAAINNLTRANRLIGELRRQGVAFALDDFGAGMSSFAYLKALTVDYLKIDSMFIANLGNDAVDFEMVSAINRIGHVMGKRTVAECVEQTSVLEKLQEIGVDYAQGFALGLPVPVDELLLKRAAPLRAHGS